jgi:Zn-dependent M28 family amino/carboxypeptidase
VALLIELARLMSSRPWNKTIMFVAFAAEEQGTFGSKFFVQDMLLGGRNFDAAINNDVVAAVPVFPNQSASLPLAPSFQIPGSWPAILSLWPDFICPPLGLN